MSVRRCLRDANEAGAEGSSSSATAAAGGSGRRGAAGGQAGIRETTSRGDGGNARGRGVFARSRKRRSAAGDRDGAARGAGGSAARARDAPADPARSARNKRPVRRGAARRAILFGRGRGVGAIGAAICEEEEREKNRAARGRRRQRTAVISAAAQQTSRRPVRETAASVALSEKSSCIVRAPLGRNNARWVRRGAQTLASPRPA